MIGRFERKGFKLVALKMQTPSRQLAEEHYADLSSKPFFKDLVNYIISGPVVCMVCRTLVTGETELPSAQVQLRMLECRGCCRRSGDQVQHSPGLLPAPSRCWLRSALMHCFTQFTDSVQQASTIVSVPYGLHRKHQRLQRRPFRVSQAPAKIRKGAC